MNFTFPTFTLPSLTLPAWFPIVGAGIALLGLILAIKNYRRKSGLHIRGNFGIASSTECNDKYVSNIIIENLKDRGVTIFAVYLRIGHNYYIELENFDEKPLILKAYETYKKEFGPIQFYGFNARRFDLNKILDDSRVKKRLILSTADGRYLVPKPIHAWSPVGDFFKNHMTAIIRPIVLTHKGEYIGENIKYILEITGDDKQEQVILIPTDEFRFNRFKNFRLTEDSLETKESLEAFLHEQMTLGKLLCNRLSIYETTEWHKRAGEFYKERIEAAYYGKFRYYVMGRFSTWLADREMKKQNSKSAHQRRISQEKLEENQ